MTTAAPAVSSGRFTVTHRLEVPAAPPAIWALLSDVTSWRRWNAGIETVALEGPFATGTWFTMKPPGQEPMRSRLLEVRPGEGFVDETQLGELVVRVGHRLERTERGSMVTYVLEAEGPGAEEAGPAIASDFPEVLQALSAATRETVR